MSTPRLPALRQNYDADAVRKDGPSTAELLETISALKGEVEQKRRENKLLKDELDNVSVDRTIDPSPFLPRGPKMQKPIGILSNSGTGISPTPPTSPPGSGRPLHLSKTPLTSPVKAGQGDAVGRSLEHPVTLGYKQIQESEMRWVVADQPFVRPAGKKGIALCDDVHEDFYRSLVNQATFNLPREVRYAIALSDESLDKLGESIQILNISQETVDKSSADTARAIKEDFELSRQRLDNKKMYFTNEVEQHKEEMIHKIDTEIAIVKLLVKTLEDSIEQANAVLDRNLRPDAETEQMSNNKTLNDIRAEYNRFRRSIMPTMHHAEESIAGRAAEFLSLEKGQTIHEIVQALLETLTNALTKAKGTDERLMRHKHEMTTMCTSTLNDILRDFVQYFDKLDEKERDMNDELNSYRRDTTERIMNNFKTLDEFKNVVTDHKEYAENLLSSNPNDYLMFKQTKEMKNQMVMMYAELSKMRIQYDGIMFELASDEMDVPLDIIGTLINASTKNAVDWSPKATKTREKKKGREYASQIMSESEQQQMIQLFREYDNDNSGTIDTSELIQIWAKVWPWATEEEVRRVAHNVLLKVDADNNGTIDFNEFLEILNLGYGLDTAEGGAFHA